MIEVGPLRKGWPVCLVRTAGRARAACDPDARVSRRRLRGAREWGAAFSRSHSHVTISITESRQVTYEEEGVIMDLHGSVRGNKDPWTVQTTLSGNRFSIESFEAEVRNNQSIFGRDTGGSSSTFYASRQ